MVNICIQTADATKVCGLMASNTFKVPSTSPMEIHVQANGKMENVYAGQTALAAAKMTVCTQKTNL